MYNQRNHPPIYPVRSMEIHSSSLAFTPNGYNAKNKAADSVALDKLGDNKKNQSSSTLPPPEDTHKNVNLSDFEQLSDNINKQHNKVL